MFTIPFLINLKCGATNKNSQTSKIILEQVNQTLLDNLADDVNI